MSTWTVIYQNNTDFGWDGFKEWWEVTDGDRIFESDNAEDAEWLCNLLNSQGEQ